MTPRWVKAWLEFLKRQKQAPEESIAFRVAVAVNVSVAILATAAQLQWDSNPLMCLVATWLAMALSYRARKRNNWEIKALLSIAMLGAMLVFFQHLARSTNDPRVPLAELLLWLQTLHSFDLPARKDLNYSLLVAVTLISIAAVMSVDLSFGAYLAAYLLTAMNALYWNQLATVRALVPAMPPTGAVPPPSLLLRVCAFILLCLALMPRYQSFRLRSLPVNWQMQFKLPRVSGGLLHNSAFPNASSPEEFRKKAHFSADSYAGFNSFVDLQMRGHLSDEVVIRARVSAFAYYRALAFVHYDGQFWSRSQKPPQTLVTEFPPMNIPCNVPEENSEEVVQIFYVEKGLPNVILSASQPSQLYFPSQQIFFDQDHDLLSPYELAEGTEYSVISRRQNLSAARLREFKGHDRGWKRLAEYRELPAALPARVGDLAREITARESSPYGQALALCSYLQNHFQYDLDTPVYPDNRDVTDYFLFESRRGCCELFATAMAVMGRSIGLTTRYVTGYLPGDYNPLTGYQEIRAHHAHAWVEVFLPGFGWSSFDPTPGAVGSLEAAAQVDHSGWVLGEYLRYTLSALRRNGSAALPAAAACAVAALGWVLWVTRAKRRAAPLSNAGRVSQAYALALEELARQGKTRSPGTSPRAFARAVEQPSFDELTRLHERAVYAVEDLDPADVEAARSALRAISESR